MDFAGGDFQIDSIEDGRAVFKGSVQIFDE
jgi:hypothetical protein